MTEPDQHTQRAPIRDKPPMAAGTGAGGDWTVRLGSPRGIGLLFAVALALRMLLLVALNTTSQAESGVAWEWGWETACVAETLLDGEPYGDPWGKGTGPSAWLTPVYPAVVAACMSLGGGVTPAAAFILFTLHAIVSALTCLMLVALGRSLGLGRVGLVAGWAFAFYPAALWNAVSNVWDTTFVGFMVTAFFVSLLRAPRDPLGRLTLAAAGRVGAIYGALLMLNPAPLGIAPAVLAFVSLGKGMSFSVKRALAFVAGAVLVCSPWMIRNQRVLGTPNLRSNLGVEFNVGNNELANGRHQTAYHPSHSDRELDLYRELGEVEYARASLRTALGWMEDHPRETAGLILRRMQIFWVGESPVHDPRTSGTTRAAEDPKAWVKWAFHSVSGLLAIVALFTFKRRTREGALLRAALMLFPVPYYLTHVMERYRFPVDPLLVFLDAWVVLSLIERRRSMRRDS